MVDDLDSYSLRHANWARYKRRP